MVEAIIQQECTTIHHSVKWRFEEEARQFMHKKLNGEQPVFKDIIFNNLYPLYGQMDIKGSSDRRNQAVSNDLTKQLNEVIKVLQAAMEYREGPCLIDAEVEKEDNVFPMIPAGRTRRIIIRIEHDFSSNLHL